MREEKPRIRDLIELIARVGWALLVAFGLVGVLAGHWFAMYVVAVSAIMWSTIRILVEGVASAKVLAFIFKRPDKPQRGNKRTEG